MLAISTFVLTLTSQSNGTNIYNNPAPYQQPTGSKFQMEIWNRLINTVNSSWQLEAQRPPRMTTTHCATQQSLSH
ncbi:hypothetical protein R3P38DRAFT_886850 [Favolaschia claudopus]|uniref:Secreted protein n=1 Tax=Favolaschia claudopus TaxID=2862362 RepID=A0AAW0BUL2_9AGAR